MQVVENHHKLPPPNANLSMVLNFFFKFAHMKTSCIACVHCRSWQSNSHHQEKSYVNILLLFFSYFNASGKCSQLQNRTIRHTSLPLKLLCHVKAYESCAAAIKLLVSPCSCEAKFHPPRFFSNILSARILLQRLRWELQIIWKHPGVYSRTL